jgi:hypothetical protein
LLVLVLAPVPGTPVSGDPDTPGPPEVPVLGALPDVPDDVAPLLPVLPVPLAPVLPGIAPRPGAPEVAVPTEPEPEVEGRSAPLVTERSALLVALALDLDCLPDSEEVDALPPVLFWACTLALAPKAAAHASARPIRDKVGFMMRSR